MTSEKSAKKPVTPKDAASLVLYEHRGEEIIVLMGKRAKGHRFLPDVYVFPGGRIDEDDFNTAPSASLGDEVSSKLSRPGDMANAIATAAIRETFEETGLIIGNVANNQLIPDHSNLDYITRAITPINSPIRFDTRFLMIEARHATGILAGSGELLDLQWVSIQTALTMPVVDVTEFVLQEVGLRLSGQLQNKIEVPLFTYKNGKPSISRG